MANDPIMQGMFNTLPGEVRPLAEGEHFEGLMRQASDTYRERGGELIGHIGAPLGALHVSSLSGSSLCTRYTGKHEISGKMLGVGLLFVASPLIIVLVGDGPHEKGKYAVRV